MFFKFSFSLLEDVKRFRLTATWNLASGSLKLFPWSKDFKPNLQKLATNQVWIHLFGLVQEYWRLNILLVIASSARTPICTDALASKSKFDCSYGHFVRVLVYMDLISSLKKCYCWKAKICIFIDIDYENFP